MGGVASIFTSAAVVGEAGAIVVMGVEKRPERKRMENPNANIGRLKKERRTIEKAKNCAGWD